MLELPPNPNCSGLGYAKGSAQPNLPSLVWVKAASGAKTLSALNKPLGSYVKALFGSILMWAMQIP